MSQKSIQQSKKDHPKKQSTKQLPSADQPHIGAAQKVGMFLQKKPVIIANDAIQVYFIVSMSKAVRARYKERKAGLEGLDGAERQTIQEINESTQEYLDLLKTQEEDIAFFGKPLDEIDATDTDVVTAADWAGTRIDALKEIKTNQIVDIKELNNGSTVLTKSNGDVALLTENKYLDIGKSTKQFVSLNEDEVNINQDADEFADMIDKSRIGLNGSEEAGLQGMKELTEVEEVSTLARLKSIAGGGLSMVGAGLMVGMYAFQLYAINSSRLKTSDKIGQDALATATTAAFLGAPELGLVVMIAPTIFGTFAELLGDEDNVQGDWTDGDVGKFVNGLGDLMFHGSVSELSDLFAHGGHGHHHQLAWDKYRYYEWQWPLADAHTGAKYAPYKKWLDETSTFKRDVSLPDLYIPAGWYFPIPVKRDVDFTGSKWGERVQVPEKYTVHPVVFEKTWGMNWKNKSEDKVIDQSVGQLERSNLIDEAWVKKPLPSITMNYNISSISFDSDTVIFDLPSTASKEWIYFIEKINQLKDVTKFDLPYLNTHPAYLNIPVSKYFQLDVDYLETESHIYMDQNPKRKYIQFVRNTDAVNDQYPDPIVNAKIVDGPNGKNSRIIITGNDAVIYYNAESSYKWGDPIDGAPPITGYIGLVDDFKEKSASFTSILNIA